jgi:hypothetical protein
MLYRHRGGDKENLQLPALFFRSRDLTHRQVETSTGSLAAVNE